MMSAQRLAVVVAVMLTPTAAIEATAQLGEHQLVQATLPVFELEHDLKAAKEGVACQAAKTENCAFKKSFNDPSRNVAGIYSFARFFNHLPEAMQGISESPVTRLRFDVFRPVVSQLMSHIDSASFVQVDAGLKNCTAYGPSSAHKLACEVHTFAQLMHDAAMSATSLTQTSEAAVETEGIMEHALTEMQRIKKEVLDLRSKGAKKSSASEKNVMRKVFEQMREEMQVMMNTTDKGTPGAAGHSDDGHKHGDSSVDHVAMDAVVKAWQVDYLSTGKVPNRRQTGIHYSDPSSAFAQQIKVVQPPEKDGNALGGPGGNYSYENAMNYDLSEKTLLSSAGRLHFWHVVNGLTMYYEDLAQYHPQAACVDGTNPRAYYSGATAGHEDKFHLYLEGGYFCFDTASCIKRCKSYKEHCSTYYWWETIIRTTGIFHPNRNPMMAGWHHTYAGYCSSDAWMGRTQLIDFDPWSGKKKGTNALFRGNYNFQAALKMQVEKGLTSRPNQLLVMSGNSAGGIGLTNTIDHIKGMLAKISPGRNTPVVLGIIDAAVLVLGARATATEWGGPAKNTFEEQTKRAWYNLKISYLYPPQMKTTLPLTGIAKTYAFAPWRLLLGEFRIPLVMAPQIQTTTIDDDFALAVTVSHAHSPPYSPKQEMYFHDYRERMYRVLEKVDVQTPRDGGYYNAVYAFRCYWHCMLDNESMFHFRISSSVEDPQMQNVALIDVLEGFLKKESQWFAVDRCEYFDCSCMSMYPVPPFVKMAGNPSWKVQANPIKYMQQGQKREESIFKKKADLAKKAKAKEEKTLPSAEELPIDITQADVLG